MPGEMSAELEAKLSMSLDDIAGKGRKRDRKDKKKGHKAESSGAGSSGGGGSGTQARGSVFSRVGSSRGKGGHSTAPKQPGWKKHVECYEDEESGDTMVRLYKTDVVRITTDDIILDSGGYSNEITKQCINEALSKFGFQVKVISGEWYVCSKTRLIRFADGVVINGAAKEGNAAAAETGGGKGGPVRVVKTSSFGTASPRFRPY